MTIIFFSSVKSGESIIKTISQSPLIIIIFGGGGGGLHFYFEMDGID